MKQFDGRALVITSGVEPEVDGGLFPAKRVVGEKMFVEASIFTDGYDSLTAILLYKKGGDPDWIEEASKALEQEQIRLEFLEKALVA